MTSVLDPAAAVARIRGRVRKTPVLWGTDTLAFKLEQHQVSGTFKARGAFNAILSARERGELPEAGVAAASGGNHGIAVATAARALGIPVHVFVPDTSAPVKLARLEATGAAVTVAGSIYAEAHAACLEHLERTGALQIHAYDQPEVVEGQATLGVELGEQAEIDTALVAVGGGGLLGGVLTGAADSGIRVVAVEPESIPSMHTALANGGPVEVSVSGVATDALGASRAGVLAHRIAAERGVTSVLVPEAEIVSARAALWHDYRIAAEYSAATAYAALRCGAYRPAEHERVAVIVCGANLDPGDLR